MSAVKDVSWDWSSVGPVSVFGGKEINNLTHLIFCRIIISHHEYLVIVMHIIIASMNIIVD